MITFGIRLRTLAGTTRGFGETEFIEISNLLSQVVEEINQQNDNSQMSVNKDVANRVRRLTSDFPIY